MIAIRYAVVVLTVIFFASGRLAAQGAPAAEFWEKPYTLSIQDNSFFVEEAFNQEDRVVQHISTLTWFQKPVRALGASFTQEWPIGGSAHQLSYELSYLNVGRFDGLGDVVLNYRYQLFDKEDGVAVAPRASIIFPTADEKRGLGLGVPGYEVNLPASKRLSELFVAHLNLGATVFPNVKLLADTGGQIRRTIPAYALGASLIVLADPNFNIMFEYVGVLAGEPDVAMNIRLVPIHILSPGVRAALNFGGLQVVPGLAVPVRLHDGVSETGVFGYLSFEHGF